MRWLKRLLVLVLIAGPIAALAISLAYPEIPARLFGLRGWVASVFATPEDRTLFIVEVLSGDEDGESPIAMLERIVLVDPLTGLAQSQSCLIEDRPEHKGTLIGGLVLLELRRTRGPDTAGLAIYDTNTCTPAERFQGALDQATNNAEALRDGTAVVYTRRDGQNRQLDVASGREGPRVPDRATWLHRAGGDTSFQLGDVGYHLDGTPRAKLVGTRYGGKGDAPQMAPDAPDYLAPHFMADTETGQTLSREQMVLLLHHVQLTPDGYPSGLVLSGVGLDGHERWRQTLQPDGTVEVDYAHLIGDHLIVVFGTAENGPRVLASLDRATGAVAYKRPVSEIPLAPGGVSP